MDTSEENLSAKLRAALLGDDLCYRDFLTNITPLCRGIINAKASGLSAEEQEDILQDVLMAVHMKKHTWRQDQPVRPWLFAITRYKIIDRFRKNGQRVFLDISEFAEMLPAEDNTELGDTMDLEKMVAQLKGKQGDIVRAIGLDGQSHSDVAEKMGMTENAVRVNFHRGLEKLRAIGQSIKESLS